MSPSVRQNILIVDDSPFDRSILKAALNKFNRYTVIEAANRTECIEKIQSSDISLVLFDVLMPEVKGTEILQEIRLKLKALDLPVIMITAMSEVEDVVEALHLGANDYVTKPFNVDIVMSRIETHLNLALASKQMAKLKEAQALQAMVTTYNHEINNALMIALGYFDKNNIVSQKDQAPLAEALWKISDIVKKITKAVEKDNITFDGYVGLQKRIKIE